MAVIDTSMDMPSSCATCKRGFVNDYFSHGYCHKLNKYFDKDKYKTCRLYDCPFKSTDELITELENEGFHTFSKTRIMSYTRVMEIVSKYCDKERNND